MHVSLAAAREGDATKAALDLGGNAAAPTSLSRPAPSAIRHKLGEAKIAVDGSVTGERPQAVLVLLFPTFRSSALLPPGSEQAS